MNQSPTVSILIPCYNADKWIAQAIESALNQTYPHTEVIVVDDGSTDGSLEVIKSFGDKIRWETGANRGGNPTRNRLLELSTGEWLQYLDADDYLLPEKLEKQINFLTEHGNADVICSPVILEYYEANKLSKSEFHKLEESFDPWILLAKWRLPQTAGALWNKKSLIEISGWREDLSFCQEYDLYLRALIAGQRFDYYGEPLSVYRQWSDNTVCKNNPAGTYKNLLLILDTLEAHLQSSGKLTEQRKDAINQTRFDCARIIWLIDHQWALRIIEQIKTSQLKFVPSKTQVPKLYQILFKMLGFATAETVAELKRKLIPQT